MTTTVAIGGLGAIGLPLARALDAGVPGLSLVAVAARDQAKAQANLAGFRNPPRLVALEALNQADIVVEAAPAASLETTAFAGHSVTKTPLLAARFNWARIEACAPMVAGHREGCQVGCAPTTTDA